MVGRERIWLWWKSDRDQIAEHETIDRHLDAGRARKRRAGAHEAGLVDGKIGMKAVACCEIERIPDLGFRIHVGAARLRGRRDFCQAQIDATGVDDGKIQQAARGKFFDVGKSSRDIGEWAAVAACGYESRIGGIDWHIDLVANAFDDAGINLPVVGLRAAVIGMDVNDGGAGTRAGDALRDDGLNGIGNAGLERAAPRAVQRCLDPDLAHAITLLKIWSFRPGGIYS